VTRPFRNDRNRDFLRLSDRSDEQIDWLLRVAALLQADADSLRGSCSRARVALIWDAPGFRTRVAFDLAVRGLGAEGVEVPIELGSGEPIEDVTRYLENWFNLAIVRTRDFELLTLVADSARIPVVNALTDHNHPCEVLSDLAFIRANRGTLDGLRVVFVGAASNLAHSWFEAATVLPISVTQVSPPGFEVDLEWYQGLNTDPRGAVELADDLQAAVQKADVIYTDCWPRSADPEEQIDIVRSFGPLQVTPDLLDRSPTGTLFLPCPPVTRGEEVSATAMVHAKCRVYEAKEWLLYAQEALIYEALVDGPL
jgi:ornithine carbamoyltransferase